MTDDETASTVLRAHKKSYWTFIDVKYMKKFIFSFLNCGCR